MSVEIGMKKNVTEGEILFLSKEHLSGDTEETTNYKGGRGVIAHFEPFELDGRKKAVPKVVKLGMTIKSVGELFERLDEVNERLDKVIGKKWKSNIVFYMAMQKEDSFAPEHFDHQDCIFFDIDKINHSRIEEYIPALREGLEGHVNIDHCITTISGNGLHIITQLKEQFTDTSFFDGYRHQYNFICDKIDEILKDKDLQGKADKAPFRPGSSTRIPGTENRKPMKDPYSPDALVTKVKYLHGKLVAGATSIGQGLPANQKKTEKSERRKNKCVTPVDREAIEEGCLFVKYGKENSKNVTEQMWWALINTVAPTIGGYQWALDLSKDHPDFNQDEFDYKFERTQRIGKPITCDYVKNTLCFKGCSRCKFNRKIKTPLSIKRKHFISSEENGFWKKIYNQKGQVVGEKLDYMGIVRYFSRDYFYTYIPDLKRMYFYNGSFYKKLSEGKVRNMIEKITRHKCTDNQLTEIYKKVKVNKVRDPDFLIHKRSGLINFKNLVVRVHKGRIFTYLPHPNFRFLYKIGYNYDELADCPNFDQMMKNITLGRDEITQLILEYLGDAMLGGPYGEHGVALLFVGEGANGKTTLLDVMKMVVGEENCSYVSITKMGVATEVVAMEHKLLNICEEEGEDCFRRPAEFKKLTGGSEIVVRNLYENTRTMKNGARIIATQNEPPRIYEHNEGMRRRIIIIPFDLNLEKHPEMKIKDIHKKLQKELPGIANKAIKAYLEYKKRGHFTIPEASIIKKKEVYLQSSPVLEWLENGSLEFTQNEKDYLPSRDLFHRFQEEMDEDLNGKGALSAKRFSILLAKYMEDKGVSVGKTKNMWINGGAVKCFVGVKWAEKRS